MEKGLRGIGAGVPGCGWVREVAPVGGGDEGDSWTIEPCSSFCKAILLGVLFTCEKGQAHRVDLSSRLIRRLLIDALGRALCDLLRHHLLRSKRKEARTQKFQANSSYLWQIVSGLSFLIPNTHLFCGLLK